VKPRKQRKPQERTSITRNLLLNAAERVFSQCGYEKAQLEEVAEVAGFSKGALYAHFKSKEELFLALAKTKAAGYQAKLRSALNGAPTREEKIAAFRSFYVNLARDREWALIILEVKLFLTRHPAIQERLRQAEDELEDSVEKAFVELFGTSARVSAKALGGIFSALVLEADMEPAAFTKRKMKVLFGSIFDTLLGSR
jgi:AcrR family transcriptional regulator